MRTRKVGVGGPDVSVIGLGCNNFGMKIDKVQTAAVVGAALDAGVTHFDTAEMYGEGASEEYLGAALGARRDEVVIASKFLPRPAGQPYEPGALAERIRAGAESSLRRLGTDRIDLYYQHYPDAEAPAEEALETLAALIDEGKVLHVASSNVSEAEIELSATIADDKDLPGFCGTQIEWSLLKRAVEQTIVPAAEAAGLGVIPYFPLASGLLTGKYRRGEAFPDGSRMDALPFFARGITDEHFDQIEALSALAERQGHTILELAIAWLLAQSPVASVIAGATTPDQVRANALAATWELTPTDLAAVEDCLSGVS